MSTPPGPVGPLRGAESRRPEHARGEPPGPARALIDSALASARPPIDRNGANQIALAIGQVAAGAQDQHRPRPRRVEPWLASVEVIARSGHRRATRPLESATHRRGGIAGERHRWTSRRHQARWAGIGRRGRGRRPRADAVRLTSAAWTASAAPSRELRARRRAGSTVAEDRGHRRDDQRHRRPDQPARAQRRHRGGEAGEQGKGFAVVADESASSRALRPRHQEIAALIRRGPERHAAAVAPWRRRTRGRKRLGAHRAIRAGPVRDPPHRRGDDAAVGRIGRVVDSMTQASGTVVESMDRIERLARRTAWAPIGWPASRATSRARSTRSPPFPGEQCGVGGGQCGDGRDEWSRTRGGHVRDQPGREWPPRSAGSWRGSTWTSRDTDAAGPAKHAVRPMGHPAGIRRPAPPDSGRPGRGLVRSTRDPGFGSLYRRVSRHRRGRAGPGPSPSGVNRRQARSSDRLAVPLVAFPRHVETSPRGRKPGPRLQRLPSAVRDDVATRAGHHPPSSRRWP